MQIQRTGPDIDLVGKQCLSTTAEDVKGTVYSGTATTPAPTQTRSDDPAPRVKEWYEVFVLTLLALSVMRT